MFMELLPVLKDRMVTLMIARLDDQLLRVNVIPKRTSDKENKAAETALSTPLTIRDRGGTGPGIRAAGAQLQRLVRREYSVHCQRGCRFRGVEQEKVTCQVCQQTILPSQQRHSPMPFPAHASFSECEAARTNRA